MIFKTIAPAMLILLAGCQVFQASPLVSKPDPVLMRAVAQQQVLWQDSVLNHESPLPTDMIRANTERVTVTWSADAVELLSHVARQRGARFTWTGVRLPLPVNIHVDGITYQDLLHVIQMQTAWRSTLHQLPGQLVLAFNQPQSPARRGE